MSDTDLLLRDLLEMCSPEYNMPELSDRVLVFDVMQDGWETASFPKDDSAIEENETKRSKQKIKSPLQHNDQEAPTGHRQNTETKQILESSILEPLRQHKLHVHSFWLAIQSAYFRSLFCSSGMKESREKEVHMKISESEENAYLILLEALYRNDVLNDKSVDELLGVIELAHKYNLEFVFKQCKHLLQTSVTTFDVSTKVMDVIKVKHNMNDVEDVLSTLLPVLVEEFSPLDENWHSKKFTNLSEACLKYILSSDDLVVQSENTVFHALMYWMETNEVDPARLESPEDLLAVVRFKLVTIDYLYNVIKNHPIATQMRNFSEYYHGGLTYHALPPEQKKLFESRPVPRKTTKGLIVQYKFVVTEEDYNTALANGSELNSGTFWACGYEISVGVNPSSNDYPYLIVYNLMKESYVPLKFAFCKEAEGGISWKEKTFSMNSCRENYRSNFQRSFFSNGCSVLYVAVGPAERR
ncbi:kelch-like protein 7 [Dendronephthya gigantea]|uniref:kelch-like protein 7 n=1 Tax=Dendronephthya gigantea TaxID=151771 RepID=UPI00106A4B25|nr:kelch-like protein 7 [Dendronephthya gigantea]